MVQTFIDMVRTFVYDMSLKEAFIKAAVEKTRQWAINKGFKPQNLESQTEQEKKFREALEDSNIDADNYNEIIKLVNASFKLNIKEFPIRDTCDVFVGSVVTDGERNLIIANGCGGCGDSPKAIDLQDLIEQDIDSSTLKPADKIPEILESMSVENISDLWNIIR